MQYLYCHSLCTLTSCLHTLCVLTTWCTRWCVPFAELIHVLVIHTYVYPCIFIVCSIFKTTLHNLCIMYCVVTVFFIYLLCPSPNNPPSSRVLSSNKLRLAGWAREDGKTTLHEIDQIAFFFPCPRVIVDATNKWMNAPEWMDECCLMYCEFL